MFSTGGVADNLAGGFTMVTAYGKHFRQGFFNHRPIMVGQELVDAFSAHQLGDRVQHNQRT
jgi:hypothetical protein